MKKRPNEDYFVPMQASCVYHVFSRTNNQELLFRNDENRRFFFEKIEKYLLPILDIYAFCLLPNHFHLMVQIKSRQEIIDWIKAMPEEKRNSVQIKLLSAEIQDENAVPEVIERQFQRMFISYAKAFNIMWDRTGHLFQRPFRRLEVRSDNHYIALICYIHRNSVKHKITTSFVDYKWSSYLTFLSSNPTKIAREKVLAWFGGIKPFIIYHEGDREFEGFDELIIE
jgi:putative transposase